tara:strand:- start:371 stop:622 length:252 start_codon:yes stop_codon:yes gene_type:complete
MKTTFKMKEATNKDEAIVSILDVLEENPVWLNKCKSSLLAILQSLGTKSRKFLLNKSVDEQVIDLFVELKTQYYHYQDVTRWA